MLVVIAAGIGDSSLVHLPLILDVAWFSGEGQLPRVQRVHRQPLPLEHVSGAGAAHEEELDGGMMLPEQEEHSMLSNDEAHDQLMDLPFAGGEQAAWPHSGPAANVTSDALSVPLHYCLCCTADMPTRVPNHQQVWLLTSGLFVLPADIEVERLRAATTPNSGSLHLSSPGGSGTAARMLQSIGKKAGSSTSNDSMLRPMQVGSRRLCIFMSGFGAARLFLP